MLFTCKDAVCLFHALYNRDFKRASAFTAFTSDAVCRITAQRRIMRPHRSRDIMVTDGADSESLKAFETVKKASKIQPSPYAFVKKWFLAEYSNYTDPTELIEKAA